MIRFLNFIKKEPVWAVTWIDRALEMAALVLGIFFVVLSVVVYLKAPQQVPVHFNAAGEINEWGRGTRQWSLYWLVWELLAWLSVMLRPITIKWLISLFV